MVPRVPGGDQRSIFLALMRFVGHLSVSEASFFGAACARVPRNFMMLEAIPRRVVLVNPVIE